jgi:drug/metabolite transporter (DMT)-like permease
MTIDFQRAIPDLQIRRTKSLHSWGPDAPRRDSRRFALGIFMAFVGAVLFSMKSVLVKLSYGAGVSPETLMAGRYGIALPIYMVIGLFGLRGRKQRRVEGAAILQALAIGMLGYWLSGYLDFLGLQYISVRLERMILFTYPFMVVAIGFVLSRRRPSGSTIMASLLSYAGLLLLFSRERGGSGDGIGALWVFLAAFVYAVYQIGAKPVIAKLGVPIATALMMIGACGASFTPFLIGARSLDLNLASYAFVLVLALSIFGTFAPFLFMNMALSLISSEANAAIGALGPVITIALAAAFLDEPVTLVDVAGMVLAILGVVWFTAGDLRSKRARTDNQSIAISASAK